MDEKDLQIVNESFRKLRDYFDSKGLLFISAWYVQNGHIADGQAPETKFNLVVSSYYPEELMEAVCTWTRRAMDYIDEHDHELKPD